MLKTSPCWGRGFPTAGVEAGPIRSLPCVAGHGSGGQMFPFCLRAPCPPDGLHKPGNVSKRLWLMVLHPPLSLKPSRVEGWRWERAGRKLVLATCLRCQPHAWPEMLGVPGDGDASVGPAMHDPEKRNPPQPCFAGQGAPQTLQIPQTLLTTPPPAAGFQPPWFGDGEIAPCLGSPPLRSPPSSGTLVAG